MGRLVSHIYQLGRYDSDFRLWRYWICDWFHGNIRQTYHQFIKGFVCIFSWGAGNAELTKVQGLSRALVVLRVWCTAI